jgi:hypothetical protein
MGSIRLGIAECRPRIEGISLLTQLALFFVPASIGVQEGGKVLAFTALGLPASAGLAVGITFRAVQAVTIALGLAAFAALSALHPSSSRRLRPRLSGSDRGPR